MEGGLVFVVAIQVRAILFYRKHGLAQLQRRVQVMHGKFVERFDAPAYLRTLVHRPMKLITTFLIAFLLCTTSLHAQSYEPRTGDLLFQDMDCGPLCDAIEKVT